MRLAEQKNFKRAFPLLARAARARIAEAEYRLGRSYLEGAGVPPSRTEGARWLERAAAQGYVEAQAQLATLAIHGLVTQSEDASSTRLFASQEATAPDFEAGLHWASKAAEGGSADGQAVLGYILTSGPENVRDLEDAHRWYERSATAGSPQGALGFALSLARDAKTPSSTPRWRSSCAKRLMPACRRHCICWQ